MPISRNSIAVMVSASVILLAMLGTTIALIWYLYGALAPAGPAVPLAMQTQAMTSAPSAGALEISGTVVSGDGQPIAGAVVSTREHFWSDDAPKTLTDSSGAFHLLRAAAARNLPLTVQATGYAPFARLMAPSSAPHNLRIMLAPGRSVSGRVTDQAGAPVAGVNVAMNGWGQFRSAIVMANTDADGRYELRDAPLDGFWVWANKDGYLGRQPWFAPEQKQIDFVLWRPLKMHGSVIDAVSRQPIAHFSLLTGVIDDSAKGATYDVPGTQFSDGKYELELKTKSERIDGWSLRIIADGYLPKTVSDLRESGEQDFELEPEPGSTSVNTIQRSQP